MSDSEEELFRPDLNRIWCPIWQCGGELKTRSATYSNESRVEFGSQIDWQIPELVCDNCHSVYRCVRFEMKKIQ